MDTRPNVLLICTDHWPASLLGVAGHPVIQTPTLDELARSGRRFTNLYSECPVCIPARRTLMTGTAPRTHGDRVFKETEPMPDLPTMAQTFRNAGYQAYAVGKLHVFPQRNRIGFDDVILDEEGRVQYGTHDDYELFLGDMGYAGQHFGHGMSNNEYSTRPWHLPEHLHATNWAVDQMCRTIKRRDPTRPAFWYLSFRHPHPPLVPLQTYLDLYDMVGIDDPFLGEWTRDAASLPYSLRAGFQRAEKYNDIQTRMARRAFYALCTHIDHQIRVVIGTLREEALLEDTILCFTSDHGDMLGNHHLWAKRLFYENSANVPLILIGASGDTRVGYNVTDGRLAYWRDIMPTLLDLAGVPVPETVEGVSLLGEVQHEYLYGENGEDLHATRMIRDRRFKLIYYATSNRFQLFDMENDPQELHDLAGRPEYANDLARLQQTLAGELYGIDLEWLDGDKFIGWPDREFVPGPNKGLSSQRGQHFPAPPKTDMPQIEWHHERP